MEEEVICGCISIMSIDISAIYDIIGANEKQATPNEAFVFHAPVTSKHVCGADEKAP